jgi:hypothetical protein
VAEDFERVRSSGARAFGALDDARVAMFVEGRRDLLERRLARFLGE